MGWDGPAMGCGAGGSPSAVIPTSPTVVSDNDVRKVGSLAGSSFLCKYFGTGWGAKTSLLWHLAGWRKDGFASHAEQLRLCAQITPFKNLGGETTC